MALYQKIRTFQRRTLEFLVRHFFAESVAERARRVVAVFADWFPEKPQSWLDIGGSWGFCAAELRRRGFQAWVLDVVRPAVQKAPVFIYPGDQVPFEDASWDMVSMITMLHHVPDPDSLVREAVRTARRYVLLVEDLDGAGGRFWTVLRDQIFNFEFFGHPKKFKSEKEWSGFFESFGLELKRYEKVRTSLLGLPIENGFYLFEKKSLEHKSA